jgi:hypothetical protein
MIFEDSFKWFVKKYLNPCKKCIVQSTCDPSKVSYKLTRSNECEQYSKYLNRLSKFDSVGSDIDVYTFLTLMGIGCLFILTTFGFGIWKWVELIF